LLCYILGSSISCSQRKTKGPFHLYARRSWFLQHRSSITPRQWSYLINTRSWWTTSAPWMSDDEIFSWGWSWKVTTARIPQGY
jgi:hypothetical protein